MSFDVRAKILIADDLPDMRRALRGALGKLGYENVVVCANGAEALAELEKTDDIALVISDWNMEPVDGLGLLAGLRRLAHTRTVPFILVSAEAGPYRQNQAMEAGVSLFMAKPFDVAALRDALATVYAQIHRDG